MPAKGDLPEMKTTSFKGTLVDMSCAGSGAAAAPSTAGAAGAAATAGGADRTCSVSGNSKQFGLKTLDGKVVPFDMVGNQRAQDQVTNNKKWNQAATSGKEIKVKISGVMSGEKLVVSSIK